MHAATLRVTRNLEAALAAERERRTLVEALHDAPDQVLLRVRVLLEELDVALEGEHLVEPAHVLLLQVRVRDHRVVEVAADERDQLCSQRVQDRKSVV